MPDEALSLFQAMRPQAPMPNQDIRTGSGDLRNLAMIPGTAAYNSRIPKPPCYVCGEDHVPNQDYGHAWQPEPPPVHDEPVAASAIMRRSSAPVVSTEAPLPPTASRRVALYVGRGDTYVLAIEEAPDWEAVHTFKVDPYLVLPLVRMARGLATKVLDKTGGDLLMLEQEESDAQQRELAKTDERGAASVRGDQSRRPKRGTAGAQEDRDTTGSGEAG